MGRRKERGRRPIGQEKDRERWEGRDCEVVAAALPLVQGPPLPPPLLPPPLPKEEERGETVEEEGVGRETRMLGERGREREVRVESGQEEAQTENLQVNGRTVAEITLAL